MLGSNRMDWNPLDLPTTHAASVPQIMWEAPDHETMQQRQERRCEILQQAKHRRRKEAGARLHTRAVLHLLRDRECYGARPRNVVLGMRRPRPYECKGINSIDSTVFDSPISTTVHPEEPNRSRTRVNDSTEPSSVAALPSTGAAKIPYPMNLTQEFNAYVEYYSVTKYHTAFLSHLGGSDPIDEDGNRPPSSLAVSTIAVAFSPDKLTVASTHGDHTVKISCCNTGRLLRSLEGHPRTPWTVKYNPADTRIVASGCLGHQVRIWNWQENTCLQMVRLEFAIISLCFHPMGKILAIANGTKLNLWGVADSTPSGKERANIMSEIDQRQMLRCVHFPPDGKSIIVGGVNPTSEDPRRRVTRGASTTMSFYLRLWDFDPEMTFLQPPNVSHVPRRAISNPRTFVPRALLYNDGGFDISPDGKTLCVCAEYWLPHDVDNAMDLYRQEEQAYEAEQLEKEQELKRAREHSPEHGIGRNHATRSPSFSDDARPSSPGGSLPKTPTHDAREARNNQDGATSTSSFVPRTPDPTRPPQRSRLSPPSPPGRRFTGGLYQGRQSVSTQGSEPLPNHDDGGYSSPPPPPPGLPPAGPKAPMTRPPHPLSVISPQSQDESSFSSIQGRYVPHVVTISLDCTPIPQDVGFKLPRGTMYGAVANGYRPRLGQLLEAYPLEPQKATAVTCVKFSPSTDYLLLGYGVRDQSTEGQSQYHPVTAVYRARGGMHHISTMLSTEDDVNIARFHPDSGYGFVYGTKQGRVRVQSPRPWMYYNI